MHYSVLPTFIILKLFPSALHSFTAKIFLSTDYFHKYCSMETYSSTSIDYKNMGQYRKVFMQNMQTNHAST